MGANEKLKTELTQERFDEPGSMQYNTDCSGRLVL